MTILDSKISTEFSEILNFASYTFDMHRLGSEILDIICKCFNIEEGGFRILTDNGDSPVTVHKNTDLEWNNLYKNHFHKFSPFRDLYGKTGGKKVMELEGVIDPDSFFSSEFYNDFYKPQNIFYKIFIKLEAKGRSIGEICLL